jgi:hypothetical protein
MTNFTKTLTLAAAAMLIATGASAQSLKADIPFAFQVGNKVLAPGTYRIANISSSSLVVFAVRGEDGESALVMPKVPHDADKKWQADGQARLAFQCGDTCSLTQIWAGLSYPAYELNRPKKSDMGTRIAVIVMRPDKGD